MAKIYVQPSKELVKYTCPHCNTLSQMEKGTHRFPDDQYYVNSSNGVRSARYRNDITIHRCQCCGKKIIWIDNNYIYPDIVPEEANLAIDRLCNELGETDRDINKNIGALVAKGLPQSVQKALDIVRVVGNKAVHPGQIVFDVDDNATATMLMHLLNMIVTRMITEPNEIDSLYQGLPESVKDSIEKRDK